MKKTVMRLLTAIIMMAMIVTLVPPLEVNAATGSDFTNNATIAARIDKALAQYGPGTYFTKNGGPCTSCNSSSSVDCVANGSDCNCLRWVTIDGKKIDLLAVQCMGYTRYWQQILFGAIDYDSTKFCKLSGVSSWNASNLEAWFENNKSVLHPGTRLHVRYRNWGVDHFITMLGIDYENGVITYIECNKDNRCGVSEITTATYSKFVSTFSKLETAWVYKTYNTEYGTTYSTIPEGEYTFNNNGYRMYMISDSKAKGTIGASNGSVTSKFSFKVTLDGSYYKISPVDSANGYVLNSYWSNGSYTRDGDEVTLWANDGDPSQRWVFEEYDGGYLIHPASSTHLSVTREGSKLYVKTTTGDANQIWTLEGENIPCEHSYSYTLIDDAYHKGICAKCGHEEMNIHGTDSEIHYNESQHWLYCPTCDSTFECSNHNYDNDCDATCFCGYSRTVLHTYDNDCDSDCNVCGAARSASHQYSATFGYDESSHWLACTVCGEKYAIEAHVYSSSGDATCDVCEYNRTVTHTYDNDCDPDCNECGATRSISHAFSAIYSLDEDGHWRLCAVCGEKTTAEAHAYSGSSDPSCDICGYNRTVTHTYDDDCDPDCNECGAIRNAPHHYIRQYMVDENNHWRWCQVCGNTADITAHSYTNDCDEQCNACGYMRSVAHRYDNDCDEQCDACGYSRSITHKYDNNCDECCNICHQIRNTSHVYSYVCDSVCNECGYERNADHRYDNECDSRCNSCGETRKVEHRFDNGTVTKEPTTTKTGEKTFTCTVCGSTRYETLPVLSNTTQTPDNEQNAPVPPANDDRQNGGVRIETVILIVAVAVFATAFITILVVKKKK